MFELAAPPITARLEDLRYAVNNDRSTSVVLDPYSFLPFNPHSRIPWQNRQEQGLFYRFCSDPTDQIPRESITDWNSIRFCDYKLHTASLTVDQPYKLLTRWLTNAEPRLRFLHISIDDSEADPLVLLSTLSNLEWSGLLGIQIVDHTHSSLQQNHHVLVRNLFNYTRLVGLDYIRQSYDLNTTSSLHNLLDINASPIYF